MCLITNDEYTDSLIRLQYIVIRIRRLTDRAGSVDVRSCRHFCPKSSTLVCVSRSHVAGKLSHNEWVLRHRGCETLLRECGLIPALNADVRRPQAEPLPGTVDYACRAIITGRSR